MNVLKATQGLPVRPASRAIIVWMEYSLEEFVSPAIATAMHRSVTFMEFAFHVHTTPPGTSVSSACLASMERLPKGLPRTASLVPALSPLPPTISAPPATSPMETKWSVTSVPWATREPGVRDAQTVTMETQRYPEKPVYHVTAVAMWIPSRLATVTLSLENA